MRNLGGRKGAVWMALVVATVVLLLGACGNGRDAPSGEAAAEEQALGDGLIGDWALRSGSYDGEPIPVATAQRITLQLRADGVGGVASCNSYGGAVTLVGSDFRVSEIAINQAACGGDTSVAERLYVSALGDVDEIRLVGAELVIGGAASALRFERLPPAAIAEVVDLGWALDGGAAGSLEAGPAAAIFLLRGDGSFEGGTGCRALTGTWVMSGDEVLMTSLRADGVYESCSPALQAQDGDVVSVIGDGFRMEGAGDRLVLISRDGERLEYRRAR